MKSIVARRAARGAEFMDGVRPGWFDEVDGSRLNIYSTKNCILGQIYGSYEVGARLYGFWGNNLALRYGFLASVFGFFPTTRLIRAWLYEIERRRVQAVFASNAPKEQSSEALV